MFSSFWPGSHLETTMSSITTTHSYLSLSTTSLPQHQEQTMTHVLAEITFLLPSAITSCRLPLRNHKYKPDKTEKNKISLTPPV
jgi:hypothetical protein